MRHCHRTFYGLAVLFFVLSTPVLAASPSLDLSPDQVFSEFGSTSTPTTSTREKEAVGTPSLGGLAVPPAISSGTVAPVIEDRRIPRSSRISRLRVEGNKNVRERVILAQVKTRKSDFYDADKLRKDVQAIYGLGNFDDVTVDVGEIGGGVMVTFHVVEKPMIKKVEFKGNKKLGSGKLRDAIQLKEKDPLDKLKLSMDVDKIMNLYKDEGFAAAQVEPYTSADPTNHVTITFFVTEGTRVLIDEVQLQGVQAFKVKKVKKLMKTRRKKVFKQDVLTKDLEEITHFYKNNGYQNVKIGEVTQTFNADKTRLTLTMLVEEGPLFRFQDSSFSGNAIFLSDKLFPAIQYKTGETFSQKKLDGSLSKLQDIYGAQGYIRVQIKPEFDQNVSSGTVSINYSIDEGEVVYVDNIGVEGNTHTKDFVIRREILLKQGEPFSSVKARRSVERLYNLGFLDNVDVDVQQPESPNKADVIFTVTEGKPGILSAGAGYSSVDGLIGTAQIQHINFLGRGQRLNLMWEIGKRRRSYDVGWTEPWFLGKPLTLGLNVFSVTRQLQLGSIQNAYKTRDNGGSVTMGPRFSDIYSLLFTYSYANRLRFDVNNDTGTRVRVLGPEAANNPALNELSLISSNLTEQIIRDTRDNQFDPQRGQRTSVALTQGGLFPANAIKFFKPSIDHSIHIPTFWKFVLSIRGNWASVKPYGHSGREDIVDELFRVGGSDSVRGYELGHVGVLDGGEIQNVYNVEYKFPIAPDENGRTLLQGVLFYDVGGSWNSVRDVSYKISKSHTGLKQGVGFGIRFKTPVFPLRLDWGHALNADPGEDQSQFYFTVGSLF